MLSFGFIFGFNKFKDSRAKDNIDMMKGGLTTYKLCSNMHITLNTKRIIADCTNSV